MEWIKDMVSGRRFVDVSDIRLSLESGLKHSLSDKEYKVLKRRFYVRNGSYGVIEDYSCRYDDRFCKLSRRLEIGFR